MSFIRTLVTTVLVLALSFVVNAQEKVGQLDLSYFNQFKFEELNKEQNTFEAKALENDYFWIKCVIPSDLLGKSLTLQISSMYFDEIHLYAQNDSGAFKLVGRSGNNFRDVHDKPTRFNQIEFSTDYPVIFLKNKVSRYAGVDLQIKETEQLYQDERWDFFKLGGYYGLAVMSVIFNLVFYVIFKDKRFISYCFLLSFIFLQFLYEDGLLIFLTTNSWILKNFVVLFSWLTAAMACVFTYHFLNIKATDSYFVKVAGILVAITLVVTLIYFFTDNIVFLLLANGFNVLVALWCCYIGIKLFKTNVLARFMIATLGIVLLFGIGYNLQQMSISPIFNFFTRDTFRLASAFEIISISFAIIYDVKKIKTQNFNYRNEIQNYVKQLEVLNFEQIDSGLKPPKSIFIDGQFMDSVLDKLKQTHFLTERELQVLKFITDGYSNQQIAEKLFVSVSTVKYHVSNLYFKLEIKNRSQAVKFMHQYANPSS